MEKDIGKIKKNDNTDVVIRIDDFGGKIGLTIREFTNDSRTGYKGFTKSGTRIPADKFLEFREIVNSISLDDLKADPNAAASASANTTSSKKAPKSDQEEINDY